MGGSARGAPAQEELDMGWEMLSSSPRGWCGLGWEQGTRPAVWPQCHRDLGSPTGSLCEYLGKQNLPVTDMAVAALAPTVGSVLEPNRILTGTLLSQELRGRAGQSPHLPTTTLVTPRALLSHCPVFGQHKRWEQGSSTAQGTARPFQSHPNSSVVSRGLRGHKYVSISLLCCCSLIPIKH